MFHPGDIVSPSRQPLWRGRQCLAGQTMSDPPHKLSDPAKTRQIVRCLRMLTHARSYLNPLNPQSGIPEGSIDSTRSIGDPRGLDRLDRGSLRARSIGDPLGLDRGSPRARSTRSIGDPLGLDRRDRSGIPKGSIDSIDRGSLRARSIDRSTRSKVDRGSTRLDSIESRSGIP